MRTAILILTASFLLLQTLQPAPVQAATGAAKAVDVGFDLVILRTAGLCSTLVGGVLFLPAAFLTLPSEQTGIDQAWESFITLPFENTFQRKLGEW